MVRGREASAKRLRASLYFPPGFSNNARAWAQRGDETHEDLRYRCPELPRCTVAHVNPDAHPMPSDMWS